MVADLNCFRCYAATSRAKREEQVLQHQKAIEELEREFQDKKRNENCLLN